MPARTPPHLQPRTPPAAHHCKHCAAQPRFQPGRQRPTPVCTARAQVEMSRWMGRDAVKALLLDKMREAVRGDIEKAMDLVEPARVPPRLTRKQAAKAADARDAGPAATSGAAAPGAPAAAAAQEEELSPQVGARAACCAFLSATDRPLHHSTFLTLHAAQAQAQPHPQAHKVTLGAARGLGQADPYEYAEPKRVLSDLTAANFWTKLEEKKWTDRKEALAHLRQLADTPRLASGDYGDVMREIKKASAEAARSRPRRYAAAVHANQQLPQQRGSERKPYAAHKSALRVCSPSAA